MIVEYQAENSAFWKYQVRTPKEKSYENFVCKVENLSFSPSTFSVL